MRLQVDEVANTIPHLDWIWEAWWRLGDERPHVVTGVGTGMGGIMIRSVPGKIAWTAVRSWCDGHGYGDDDRDMLDYCIQSMDGVFIPWWVDKNKPRS